MLRKESFLLDVGVLRAGVVVMVMMLSLLDFKIQSKRCSFQAFATRYENVVVFQETSIGWLTVYEPGQMGGGLGSARCTINVDFIANLIPRTSTAYFWTNFWQHWNFFLYGKCFYFFLRLAHCTKYNNRNIIFLVLLSFQSHLNMNSKCVRI